LRIVQPVNLTLDLPAEGHDKHAVVAGIGDRQPPPAVRGDFAGKGERARTLWRAATRCSAREADRRVVAKGAVLAPFLYQGGNGLHQRQTMTFAGYDTTNGARGIDQHKSRPGTNRVALPRDHVRVVQYGVGDAMAGDRAHDGLVIVLFRELGRMHADNDKVAGK